MALQFKDDEIVVNTDPLPTDKLFAEVNFRLERVREDRIVSSPKLQNMYRPNTYITVSKHVYEA